jgi:hypothetical protein
LRGRLEPGKLKPLNIAMHDTLDELVAKVTDKRFKKQARAFPGAEARNLAVAVILSRFELAVLV